MSAASSNKQIIAITGATATGKSKLALNLAEALIKQKRANRVFLLSVDSRQVYRGLETLTAATIPHGWQLNNSKPYPYLSHQQLAISLHGVSIIPIWQDWSPAHLQKLYLHIKQQLQNNDFLILVGGTGFYHRQLNQPAATLFIKPNLTLRQQLNKKSVSFLQEQLQQLDPEKLAAMNQSDVKNPRRLIRAIEVAKALQKDHVGKTSSEQEEHWPLNIHLTLNKKEQAEQIKRRVAERYQDALHEVRACVKQYKLSAELPAASAIGFKELLDHIEQRTSLQASVLAWQKAEIQYSKRQATWWKKINNLKNFAADDPELLTKTLELVL